MKNRKQISKWKIGKSAFSMLHKRDCDGTPYIAGSVYTNLGIVAVYHEKGNTSFTAILNGIVHTLNDYTEKERTQIGLARMANKFITETYSKK